MSDEDHRPVAGLDRLLQTLERLVDATEGDEDTREIEVQVEIRAAPLQRLELCEEAPRLLRSARRTRRILPKR